LAYTHYGKIFGQNTARIILPDKNYDVKIKLHLFGITEESHEKLPSGYLPPVKGKKVKLSLSFFLTEHHAMKAYWGVEV
jgi:hypothetical protein